MIESCKAMQMSAPAQLAVRRCQPSESRAAATWLEELHYLRSVPPGYVHALEFISGCDLVGVMLIGRPASRSYDPDRVLELSRVFFIDLAPYNTESQALALMRRHVRTWLPGIRLLIAYSDPEQGHSGTIYEADGWAPFGLTDQHYGYGWKSRNGRRTEQLSRKQRWVRTP
jgi:hypothetical protein